MSYDLKLTSGSIELSGGQVQLVKNQNKLSQDILKMLFTATGENKAHLWYGTPMLSRAVGNSFNLDILPSELTEAITYGIKNLKTLQDMQSANNQFVTPQELISRILNIKVDLDGVDSRKLVVKVQIATKSNDLISESFTLGV